MEFIGRKRSQISFNIAPLIDVVFLLLLFYMLTSHFATRPGIKVSLPRAETARPQREEEITIFVDREQNLFLNRERVSIDQLLPRLTERLEASPTRAVTVKADEEIPLGLAVKIMDIARQARAEHLVISTKVREE